jgi:outer membrane receptor protein involved in Fe transport
MLWLLGLPVAIGAQVEGVVTTSTGAPIEHVRVEIDGDAQVVFSGRLGDFYFETVDIPAVLRFSHPRFIVLSLTVGPELPMPLTVVLQAKQEVFEEIAVTATPGEDNFSPVSLATSVIEPDELPAPPSTLTEMVIEAPAVSENGQGGIFQTYSIRGISRQRVMTLISGMRIVGERRAGVSASFLDPRLMESVDVLRGPSSTFYGSGALGGVIQIFPRKFESWAVEGGYQSQGNETYLLAGWGDEQWSLGLSRRAADDSEAPDGQILNTAFEQTSGTARRQWASGRLRYDLQAVASLGEDIGKSNTDFPERTTVYPDERHLLVKFAVRSESDWRFEAWTHPNSVDTKVQEAASESRVENSAVDFGLNWQKQIKVAGTVSTRFGVDFFGRRNVDALETATDSDSGESLVQQTLDNGEDNEAGVYGAMEWNVGRAVILGGSRFAFQSQRNASQTATSDHALTGFAGLVVPLGAGFELVSNLGTGLRFPSLSERYFSGTTGRGEVVSNADLDPERSLNLDVGLRWYGDKLFVSGFVSRNEISDYIERIEIEPDVLTFVNLVTGKITGFELSGFYQFDEHWRANFGGHVFDGRDEMDDPLADIPASRFHLGGAWQAGPWVADMRWEERQDITDPGPGEKDIPGASLVSASLQYTLANGLAFSLSGRNLLDTIYFNSADRKVAYSPGRSVGLTLRWRR